MSQSAPAIRSTIWRKICKVPRVLVATPDYIAAEGRPQTPDDLAGFACLSYQSDAREWVWELSIGAYHRSHKADGTISANDGDFMAQLVLIGEGIALLPRFIVAGDVDAGRLIKILPDWATSEIWLTLYYPPYNQLPLRVATFSDFFEAHVKETCAL